MADVAPVLDEVLISKLAREVARNIIEVPTLLKTFGLSQDRFDQLVDQPMFQQRLTEEQAIWNASDPMSIGKRIGAKSLTMIEEYLPELYGQLTNPEIPMQAKVEALKQLSRWGGIGENNQVKGGADDAKVKITINIGPNKLEFDKEKLPARVIEGDVVDLTPTTAS